MKLLTTTLLALLISVPSVWAKDHSLTLSDPTKPAIVEIMVMNGSVTVIGYEGKTVEISTTTAPLDKVFGLPDKPEKPDLEDALEQEAISHSDEEKGDDEHKPSRSSSAGLQKILNNSLQIEIEQSQNKVEIASHSRRQQVNLTVKVPYKSNVSVQLNRGDDIKVSQVAGELELTNNRGAIFAQDVVGPIIAETQRKDIEVVFKSLNQDSPSSLTSHRGSIDVSVPADLKGTFTLQTYRGEVFSGLETSFAVVDQVEQDQQQHGKKITIGGLLSGKVNGGGQSVAINTYRGNIYLRKNQ